MNTLLQRIKIIVENVSKGQVSCYIPAWRPNQSITIPITTFPIHVQDVLPNRKYIYVMANLKASNLTDLGLTKWDV